MLQSRSIPMTIIFSIITFGIYAIYWQIKFHAEVRDASGEGLSTLLHILAILFTFGIYAIYWNYVTTVRLNNLGGSGNPILNLILSLVGFSFVAWIFHQSEANKIAG